MSISDTFKVYGKPNCPWCVRAEDKLDSLNKEYEKVDVSEDENARNFLKEQGFKTVPQIYHGDEYIGGYEELADYLLELT